MVVKKLNTVKFEEVVECFLSAFENYYVKMPTDGNYYRARWNMANVDFNLSYGMFEQGQLIGFIIHAVDKRDGKLTAFNTGTGVLPHHRGKKIVKSIYHYALPELKREGVTHCCLEVITNNTIAIRSYQRIGFEICRKYKCFSGELNLKNKVSIHLNETSHDKLDWDVLPNQQFYSWDNQIETIKKGNYKYFQILNNNTPESFFVINPDNGYVAQFDILDGKNSSWGRLFSGINKISNTIKINNVDERLTNKVDYLNSIGLLNTVDQYEMSMKII